jgi:hypothetical protein
MKDEEFKQRLSQVAQWKIPETPRETSLNAKKKRGRKSAEEVYQEEHENVFLEIYNGVNPTFPPLLTKVKIQGCMCEDCGRFCENGRKTEVTKYYSNRPHWRERCVTCGMNQNPNTGAWDLNNKDASAHWANWLRKTSEKPYAYKKKKTITIHPDKKQED